MYKPNGAISLDNQIAQIRLGIQSPPGEGKTMSASTFPFPVYANFNRGLGALTGRSDILEIPFWNDDFVDALVKRTPPTGTDKNPPNKRDALLKWIRTEGKKLEKDQTLVIDAGSDVETAFDTQEKLEPVFTDAMKIDTFAFWRHKIEYFGELHDELTSLACGVIWISHETVDRDKKGELNGKVRPLLTGQYGDKIVGKYTDWFRQHCGDKKPLDKVTPETLKLWGFKSTSEYKEMQDKFTGNSIYFWQTEGDDICSCKRSSLVNAPRYIPAYYEYFLKYSKFPVNKI